ncbi:MAG TPA: hypothetical protein VFO85_02195 [Vicinamibacteria bacterium]|nr:hypothetical protein [Vicinamibacteria bacterium]
MGVHVPQAWNEVPAAAIDDASASGRRRAARRRHLDDARSGDPDALIGDETPCDHVYDGDVVEGDLIRTRGRGRDEQGGDESGGDFRGQRVHA